LVDQGNARSLLVLQVFEVASVLARQPVRPRAGGTVDDDRPAVLIDHQLLDVPSKLPDDSAESYERLHVYASTVPVQGNEHIRVEDVGISSYGPVVGHRLAGDAIQIAALAEVGFCGGNSDWLTQTLHAVNYAIAKRANDAVWRQVLPQLPPQGGWVFAEPSYMWLDTGQEPAL
jgi:hypothetical protein